MIIRDGIVALLIYAPPDRAIATSITWMEGGLEFTVMGPRSTFTDQAALTIANAI